MQTYVIRRPSTEATIQDQMDEFIKLSGKGVVVLVTGKNPEGDLTSELLTTNEAKERADLNAIMGSYRKALPSVTLKDGRALKDHMVVVFICAPADVERPQVMVQRAVVDEEGIVLTTESVLSTADGFLVYRPSGSLTWKPLGKRL
jgi:hypothetical protein